MIVAAWGRWVFISARNDWSGLFFSFKMNLDSFFRVYNPTLQVIFPRKPVDERAEADALYHTTDLYVVRSRHRVTFRRHSRALAIRLESLYRLRRAVAR